MTIRLPAETSGPSPRGADDTTRALILTFSVWSIFVGMIVRLRIHHDVPLPSSRPLAWLLTGFLQDLAVLAIVAAGTLIAARWPALRTAARTAFAATVGLITLLHIIRAEAVVFYGDVIRPEDLRGDVPITMAARSLSGMSAVLAALAALTLPLAFLIARRIDGRKLRWLMASTAVLGFLVSAGAAAVLSHNVPAVGLARNPIVSLFAIERERMASPNAMFAVKRPEIAPTALRRFAAVPGREYIDHDYPLAYFRDDGNELASLRSGIKPNILFFVMESVRAEEVGCYGADPPGVTPNLDALARQGIRFDPAYSSGTYTASAELALWYGLPPIPREVLLTSRPSATLTGLPEILRANGWRTLLWIHGGDSNFYRRDSFYIPRGFQIVDGRSFPEDDPSTNWGYSDRALARNAITVLNRAREPFAAMMLTVTNHFPFQLPSDADPPLPLPPRSIADRRTRIAGMIQTVHYTDEALGDFIREARKRPWFSRTIIVVTGDHGVTIPPYNQAIDSSEDVLQLVNRVPLIMYSPMLPGGIVVRGPASHIDLLPTLLRLAGVSIATGLGVDLLDPRAIAPRVMPTWNAHRRVLTLATQTRVYHAAFRGSGPLVQQKPVETLFDPVRDRNALHNLATAEPETVARFRDLTTIYMNVYPWLVVHGTSGLPAPLLHRGREAIGHRVSSASTPAHAIPVAASVGH
jgi:arylsulfatase A-like enzyme